MAFVPKFELSAADETALSLVREWLGYVNGPGIRLTTVDVVRYCVHRASASVAETLQGEEVGGGKDAVS